MVSLRCKILVKEELRKLGLHFVFVDLGEIEIMEDPSEDELDAFRTALATAGLELMDDKKAILIEKVKNVIIQMIHSAEELPILNYSEHISASVGYDYTYISNLFSEVKGITIQQYIILNKIEKIKELIMYDELTITEIAYKMNYSSVAHLSNQFKKITGYTPSHFKNLKDKRRIPVEELGKDLTD